MKARLQEKLPPGDEWSFELKFDGIRAIAIKTGKEVQLFSRLPREITQEYPHVVAALRRLPARQFVLDGEICALDPEGRTSFQLLQNRRQNPALAEAIVFYLFDLLNLDGHDLKTLPLVERQRLLATLLKSAAEPLRLSVALVASADRVWREVTRRRLEGIVAKRQDSAYEPGRRSGAWVKVKSLLEQEFVIGGYTLPEGKRKYFGALTVGYYAGDQLMFASRVGTGFDFATLKSLHELFQRFRTEKCPFVNLPTKRAGRFGQGITTSDMRRCTWLRPTLVCQVRFMEWTADGNLRHPVFMGMREDKNSKKVVRESSAESAE